MDINIESLLTPIPGDNPSGQEMKYSNEFDDLKEARRFDDPLLAQGEWQKELKKADWLKVEKIAFNVLTTKSKDLQFAVWLVEALTQKYQFDGLNQGLQFVCCFLETFWDSLYPAVDDDNLDSRVAKLEWLNNNLPAVIYSLPLCSGESGKYSWQDIQQAREVENLGRKDPDAMKKAIEEGKQTQEKIDQAILETSDEFIFKNYEVLRQCQQSCADLIEVTDKLFIIKAISPDQKDKNVAPSMKDLGDAIDNVCDFIARIAKTRQLVDVDHNKHEVPGGDAVNNAIPENSVSQRQPAYSGGSVQTREEALRVLAEVSIFFKKTEPHNPIYYLLDRAIKWGNMPLDQWLHEMINEGWTDLPALLKLIGKQESS